MNCEEFRGQYSDLLERDLEADMLATMASHRSSCDVCHRFADDAQQSQDWLEEEFSRERLGDIFTEKTMQYAIAAVDVQASKSETSVWFTWSLVAAAAVAAVLLLNSLFPAGPEGDNPNHQVVVDQDRDDEEQENTSSKALSEHSFEEQLVEAKRMEDILSQVMLEKIEFDGESLQNVVRYMANVSDVDFLLTEALIEEDPEITVSLKEGTPLLYLLNILKTKYDLRVGYVESRILISTLSDASNRLVLQIYDVKPLMKVWHETAMQRQQKLWDSNKKELLDEYLSENVALVEKDIEEQERQVYNEFMADTCGLDADHFAELVEEFTPSNFWGDVEGASLEVRSTLLFLNATVEVHMETRDLLSFLTNRPAYKMSEDRVSQMKKGLFKHLAGVNMGQVNFINEPFVNVMGFFSELANVDFIISSENDPDREITLTLNAGMKADSFLRLILQLTGNRISMQSGMPSVVFIQPDDIYGEQNLHKALFSVLDIDCDLGEEEILELLHQYTGGDSWDDTEGAVLTSLPGYILLKQAPEVLQQVQAFLNDLNNPVQVK